MSDDEETIEEAEEVTEENEASVVEEEEIDPRTLLTKEQVQYYKNIFDEFDSQQKERIPTKTIGFVIRLMGFNPTKAEIKELMALIDPERKGVVDFYSFLLPIAQKINDEKQTHEEIIEAFRMLDKDGQDYVNTHELIEYLTTLAEDFEDFEIESFLKIADPKGIGKIYYVELVENLFGISRKSPKKSKGDKKDKKDKKK